MVSAQAGQDYRKHLKTEDVLCFIETEAIPGIGGKHENLQDEICTYCQKTVSSPISLINFLLHGMSFFCLMF